MSQWSVQQWTEGRDSPFRRARNLTARHALPLPPASCSLSQRPPSPPSWRNGEPTAEEPVARAKCGGSREGLTERNAQLVIFAYRKRIVGPSKLIGAL